MVEGRLSFFNRWVSSFDCLHAGGELWEKMKRSQFSEREAALIVQQVLLAIAQVITSHSHSVMAASWSGCCSPFF